MTQQQTLALLKTLQEITGSALIYYHTDGQLRAVTPNAPEPLEAEEILRFLEDGASHVETETVHLFRLEYKGRAYGALSLEREYCRPATIGLLAASQLSYALASNRESPDRSGFIRRLLKGEMALDEILDAASRLHIPIQSFRVVYLIEGDWPHDPSALQTIRSLYPENRQNYLVALDENHLALVRSAQENSGEEELINVADTLFDMLSMENMWSCRVSVSTPTDDLRKLSDSLKEARAAMEVGKIFYSDRRTTTYSSLGIGRLIYQIPRPLCQMYLNEVFGGEFPAVFDEETLNLVEKFFENNLNTSETARKLYIHRNTLIYRLDKIQKETGLDLRTFDDAVSLKIALLVRCYLRYQDQNN